MAALGEADDEDGEEDRDEEEDQDDDEEDGWAGFDAMEALLCVAR
jgi:hypothetical protein